MDNNVDTQNKVKKTEKVWRTPKSKIVKLADMMNEASIHPLVFSDDVYYVFDAAMTPEEIDFMLKMGGENNSFEQLQEIFMAGGINDDEEFIHEYFERNIDRDNNNEVRIRLVHNVTSYNVNHDIFLDYYY